MGRRTNVSIEAADSSSFTVLKSAYSEAKGMQSMYPSEDDPEVNPDERRVEIQRQVQRLIAESIPDLAQNRPDKDDSQPGVDKKLSVIGKDMTRSALHDLGLAVLRSTSNDLKALAELISKEQGSDENKQLDRIARDLVLHYLADREKTFGEATRHKIVEHAREQREQTTGLQDEVKVRLDDGTEAVVDLNRIRKAISYYVNSFGPEYTCSRDGDSFIVTGPSRSAPDMDES